MVDKSADSSELSEQIKAIQAELLSLTESVRSYSTQHAAAGAEAVRDAAGRASESARATAEEARKRGEKMAEDLEGRITTHPLPAVLIAAGVGLVIGAILGRR
jgi:ElaB/YqjD/DUF883 family membrane-anchored ribosome-binding protein